MNKFDVFLARNCDSRNYLHNPIETILGTVYTNGHVLVINENAPKANSGYAPKIMGTVNQLLQRFEAEQNWLPMPNIDWTKFTCSACNGSGTAECPECHDNGEVFLENEFHEYVVDCKSCAENPEHECNDCHGHGIGGKKSQFYCIGVGTGNFAEPGYFKAAYENLKNVCFAIPPSNHHPILLKFDGGWGAIAQLRRYEGETIYPLIENQTGATQCQK